ncbi:MAG: hypothetical protein VBE63_01065 [Lamprobacter sp.]|uniref:hypothetical protein n=1 Tax=Lamprobacter sp. TaxID=3100796 RepID=UPI002B25F9AD|nr:hypothetical protein [Lamprobacter sp.]MEA3638516.1 hypothetical protein [Lamprobacter sp.]
MAIEPAHPSYVHRVDAELRISFVSEAWLAFASDNGYATTAGAELGRPLFSVIADEETRHVYQLLIERARASREALQFGYRCDSPERRRWMQMQMRYLADSDEIEFASRLLRTEPRPYMPLIEFHRHQPASRRVLSMCSWCKTVLAEHAWVEVEEAVMQLRLFAAETMPRISHGICPDCSKRLHSLESA